MPMWQNITQRPFLNGRNWPRWFLASQITQGRDTFLYIWGEPILPLMETPQQILMVYFLMSHVSTMWFPLVQLHIDKTNSALVS